MSLIMHALIMLTLSCLSPAVHAIQDQLIAKASENTEKHVHEVSETPEFLAAVKSLASYIKPYVHESKRAVFTYHYEKKSRIGVDPNKPLDVNDPKVTNHLKAAADGYWDPKHPISNNRSADSLLLAIDPYSSRILGGAREWALFRIILPKKTVFLDLVKMAAQEHTDGIPLDFSDSLKKAGCEYKEYKSVESLFRRFSSEHCRAITLKTLKDTGIEGILYDRRAGGRPYYPNKDNPAVMLVRTEQISPSSVAIFDASGIISSSPPEELSLIEGIFRKMHRYNVKKHTTQWFYGYLWEQVTPIPPTKLWMDNNTIGSDLPLW